MADHQTHRRAVPEWRGVSPDTAVPARVQLRVIERAAGCCEECGRAFGPALRPEIDHKTALINGGENRENNLQALCPFCHLPKTAEDVAEKAKVARVRAKHLGLAPRKKPIGGWAALRFKKMPDGRVVAR